MLKERVQGSLCFFRCQRGHRNSSKNFFNWQRFNRLINCCKQKCWELQEKKNVSKLIAFWPNSQTRQFSITPRQMTYDTKVNVTQSELHRLTFFATWCYQIIKCLFFNVNMLINHRLTGSLTQCHGILKAILPS